MSSVSILSLALVLALGNDPALSPGSATPAPSDRSHAIAVPGPLETPSSPVAVGDPAPDFSFRAVDGQWRRLTDLRAQGPVLLVLAPDDHDLRALQSERDHLLDLGVVPVAVCDLSPRSAYDKVRTLKLGFSLLADPQRVIAGQFDSIDPRTSAATPAWFVVDQKGRVRALGRDGIPAGGFTPVASRALGVPMSDEPRPASTR